MPSPLGPLSSVSVILPLPSVAMASTLVHPTRSPHLDHTATSFQAWFLCPSQTRPRLGWGQGGWKPRLFSLLLHKAWPLDLGGVSIPETQEPPGGTVCAESHKAPVLPPSHGGEVGPAWMTWICSTDDRHSPVKWEVGEIAPWSATNLCVPLTMPTPSRMKALLLVSGRELLPPLDIK